MEPGQGHGHQRAKAAPSLAVLIPAVLALAVLALYGPTLDNRFVSWDDPQNLEDNPHFRGLGLSQIKWAFTTFHMGVYQPLGWLMFGLIYSVSGLEPFGYFLVSLILHAAATVVFYHVSLRLLDRTRISNGPSRPAVGQLAAGVSAGIFAFHPLRVEVVSWATDLPYGLAGLLGLLSVWAYLHDCPANRESWCGRPWLAVSIVLFALSLLAKAVAVSLPLVLIVLDIYPLRRLRRGLNSRESRGVWLENVPYAVLAAIAAVITAVASTSYAGGRSPLALPDRLAVTAFGLVFYLVKMIQPVALSPYYPFPQPVEALTWSFLGSAAAVAAVTIALILIRRSCPAALAAWVCYLLILLPSCGLVQHASHITADRYAHLSCLPWALLIGAACGLLWSRWSSRLSSVGLAATGALSLVGLFALTWRQQHVWRDSLSLWTHVNRVTTPSPVGLTGLGNALVRTEQVSEGIARYHAALNLDPGHADALANLGLALARLARFGEAAARFEEALRLRPDDPGLHANLGNVLWAMGRQDPALEHYRLALDRDPNHVDARYNLALALARRGDVDAASEHYLRVLALRPDHTEARNNLGNILLRQGRYEAALVHFRQALAVRPGYVTAQVNAGIVLTALADYGQAVRHYRQALKLDPDNVLALDKLAELLATCPDARLRDAGEAVSLAERAVTLTGGSDPRVLRTQARAQAANGRLDEAAVTLARAINLAETAGLEELVGDLTKLQADLGSVPNRPR